MSKVVINIYLKYLIENKNKLKPHRKKEVYMTAAYHRNTLGLDGINWSTSTLTNNSSGNGAHKEVKSKSLRPARTLNDRNLAETNRRRPTATPKPRVSQKIWQQIVVKPPELTETC